MMHFTLFWENGNFVRLDHWDGMEESLPGEPEDIQKIILWFDDGSSLEFDRKKY